MSAYGDFVVTVHALERLKERFPEFVGGFTDHAVGHCVLQECIDAADAGRMGTTPPIEFSFGVWRRRAGHFCCWTDDRTRGYVLYDDGQTTHVKTVLIGLPRADVLARIGA